MSTSVSSTSSLSPVATQDMQLQSDVERVTGAVTALIGAQAAAKVIGRPGGVLILDSDELRKLNWTRIVGARTQRRKPDGRGRMILPQASELGMWGIGEGGARQSFRSPVENFAQELLNKVEIGAMGFEEANEVFRTYEGDATKSALLTARYAQGFYIPTDETTVLVADRIEPGKEVAVYLHEVVHSQGMKILGADAFDRLVSQIKAWNSAPRTTLEWRVQAAATRRALASASADSAHYDEELFAYAVEEAVAAGVRPTLEGREGSAEQWLGDVVATLRGAIFQITQGAAPELDAQQIVDLAYALAQMESPDRAREIMEALADGAEKGSAQHTDVAGTMESLRLLNGPLSTTPQFAQWFGASKVVDHDGMPLVVYHGTGDDFSEFDPTKIGSRHVDVEAGTAFYFSSDIATANWYADDAGQQRGHGANVMPVYLALQNPRIVDFAGAGLEFLADEIEAAKERGNDGLIAIDYDDGGRATHYVAFKPEQIKSALGNSGAFDPNSQDIRFSLDPGLPGSANSDLCFMPELQQCGDRLEAGFHFEEGGCWGMALALQEVVGGELFLRDGDFVHVYCKVGEQLYDWQGAASNVPGREISRGELLAHALANGIDEEALQSDREFAHQIIRAARDEAQKPAVPDSLRFSFAGATAATADLKAHADAVAAMDAEGDAEQIRQRTGWFLGPDNNWRFEIDDSKGFTKGVDTFGEVIMKWYRLGVERTGDQLYRTRVADLIWHSELFKAYPQLRDIEVRMMPAGAKALGSLMHDPGDSGNPVLLVQEGLPSRKWYSVVMHELQHQIQVIEGFAMGGCHESFGSVPFDLAREEGLIGQGLTDEQIKASLYRRLAGEVEARNTQTRLSMDTEQRVSTPPMATADTPVGQQLVRFRNHVTGGLRFSFAGQLATTADASMLRQAQALVSQGESGDVVRKSTGWHQGVDGQWRFEVSDAEASLHRESSNPQVYADIFDEAKQRKGGVPLAKVLEHPALYAAYPKLKALRLVINNDMPADGILVAAENELHMKDPYSYRGGHSEFLSNCCHEVQHWIQRTEGFARGGSPLGMQRYAIEESRKDLESRFGDLPSYRKAVAERKTDQWTLDAIQATGIGIAPHEAYWRLAGEVEARSVQARLKMTPEERMATAPAASADVAEHEQIVLMPGGPVELQPDALRLLAEGPDALVLSDVLRHPDLFSSYPLAAFLPVRAACASEPCAGAAAIGVSRDGLQPEMRVVDELRRGAWRAIERLSGLSGIGASDALEPDALSHRSARMRCAG